MQHLQYLDSMLLQFALVLGSVWLASQTMCKSKAMNEVSVAIAKSLKWRRAFSNLDAQGMSLVVGI